jgi:type II secretory pathway pseudopilin PulG
MKLIITLLILAIILFGLYKYFKLDKNKQVQQSIQTQNYSAAESAIQSAIGQQLAAQAKQYLQDHNNYFVSTSDNLCKSAQSLFAGLEKFTSNPVECVAQAHTFTARIKEIGSDSYFCADTSGFYTTPVTEVNYIAGVQCK